MSDEITTPKLYVGTYAKYNDGNLAGAWVELDDFPDKGDFHTECLRIHADEADPELMFQDFEGFPRSLYSESGASEELFEWVSVGEADREVLAAYRNCIDERITLIV